MLASLSSFTPTDDAAKPVGAHAVGPRVGIIVPKHRHSGVERNQLKRRLRELVRLRLLPVLPHEASRAAVVLRARPEAYAASFEALARDVDRAAREAVRLLSAPPTNGPTTVDEAALAARLAAGAPSDASSTG